eukprot:CAMPEP_0184863874 /NCGR_PEP_ID=MMETSP0580-20130426/12913_1 /TAXON_ID=1118495 /ORGANISM="Dactyliosolen fragilissimus" /LENGTH=1134 /DNA_ID=CAMNT_0027362451 /DNA_START=100 /DNA_END=3504 /DNA_ORIENTATION=-
MNIPQQHEQEEVDNIENSTNETQNGSALAVSSPPAISKSWSIQSAHVPSYSGGKVILCRGRGIPDLISSGDESTSTQNSGEEMETVEENEERIVETPFLLAPRDGDLTIIDAKRGVLARSVRGVYTNAQNQFDKGNADLDDNDEDGVDREAITAYCLSPDGKDLMTIRRDHLVRIHDMHKICGIISLENISKKNNNQMNTSSTFRKPSRTLGKSGHDLPVMHAEFHPSGAFFATGGIDGRASVWDARGGYTTHAFRPHSINGGGLRGSVSSIAWCQDITKLWLAIGREDGAIAIHDLRRCQNGSSNTDNALIEEHYGGTVKMNDHVAAVTCTLWNSSLDLFFTGGRDQVIHTYTMSEIQIEDQESITNHLITEQKLKRNKIKKKKMLGTSLVDKINNLESVKTKIVYKRIHTIPIYESIEGMVILPKFHTYSNHRYSFGGISTSDIIFATAGSKGIVKLWKSKRNISKSTVSEFECIYKQNDSYAFGEKRGGYTGLMLSNSNVSGESAKDELLAIDAEHNMTFITLNSSPEHIKKDSNNDDGADETELSHQHLLSPQRTIVGHNDEILDLAVIPSTSSNTLRVAIATNSPQLRIFELHTYSCTLLEGHTDTILCVDVSPCGRYLATCGKDKTARIWHMPSSGVCIASAVGHTEAMGSVCLSRQIGRYDVVGKAATNGAGSFLVTVSRDRTIKRWNLPGNMVFDKTAKALMSRQDDAYNAETDVNSLLTLDVFTSSRAHEKDINVVSVAPNDSLVATGSQDKTVKIWNSSDLTLKGVLRGHKRGVWDCQFSLHDRVIATCSGDKTVKLWSLSDFNCVRTFQGHVASTLRVRFLSSGLQLVSSGADGLVKLWTIRTNECEATMDAHSDRIWAMDISSDGDTLVSGGADSKIVKWKDTTKNLEDNLKEEQELQMLLEQKLANHLRYKEYGQALDLTLEMDKPRQALKVMVAIVENDMLHNRDSLHTLKSYLSEWSMSRIVQLLRYCRDWNTQARNSFIAMLVVKAIFSTITVDKLSKEEGVSDTATGIMPYAERHFDRIDNLYLNSHVIDFVLSSMGDLKDENLDEYSKWESKSSFVLPPKKIDGRVQLGGKIISGFKDDLSHKSDDDVETLGDSDTASLSKEDSDSSTDDEESSTN